MNPPERRQRLFLSYLYVPGHQPERIARAYASDAHAVILDLEDGVPEPRKAYARAMVSEMVAGTPLKPTYVRLNSMASGLCKDDVLAVAGAGLSGVRLPKVEHPDDVRQLEWLLQQAGSSAAIHLLLETARALELAYPLATASPVVEMLGLGETDLQVDLNSDLDGPTMDACRTRVIMASRAAGLSSPCQSVFSDIRDLDNLLTSSVHGKRLGFVGRMAIHPAQIPIIHDVYTPKPNEVAEAQEICDAAALAQAQNASIIITPNGRTVGPPMIAKARRTLEIAAGINSTEESS
ncbi:CoA ester lyase [Streptomyces sp. NPDC052101]|uniref:HpcH/HpaI aldolase/citrate lyase family protein n=1 Tax=Streptomyces sp. NPDC052101 TaxID=3155763 RepID=UPI0034232D63